MSRALESYLYGDPAKVLEIRQSQQTNAQKRAEEKRRTLTVRPGWSEARQAAEALFTNFAGGGAVSTVPSPAASATGLDPASREEL